MTNDAKLGLVLGVAIVLVIGLVFFRQEPGVSKVPGDLDRATALKQDSTPAPSTHIFPGTSENRRR